MAIDPVPTEPVNDRPRGFIPGPGQLEQLLATLADAGLKLGTHDQRIAEWVAGWEWSTVATIASWVKRAADPLATDATEYRVHLPENGGETLLVRRQALAHGTGWAVSTYGPGGGLAWTTEGWQDGVGSLSVDRLFCWPDAATAVDEARRALANA